MDDHIIMQLYERARHITQTYRVYDREDFVQGMVLHVWENRHKRDYQAPLMPWARACMRNFLINKLVRDNLERRLFSHAHSFEETPDRQNSYVEPHHCNTPEIAALSVEVIEYLRTLECGESVIDAVSSDTTVSEVLRETGDTWYQYYEALEKTRKKFSDKGA